MPDSSTPANPPPDHHLDSLDGWRGMAILLLLCGHFMRGTAVNFGALGVSAFFVLSGWLMTRLLFVKRVPLGLFFRRRLSRILPAHVAYIGIVCIVMLAQSKPVSPVETLAALFFLKNYVNLPAQEALMPFGHLWSLAVEEHSYALLALVALAGRRGLTRDLFTVAAIACTCLGFAVLYRALYPELTFRFFLAPHTEVAAWGIFASATILIARRRPRLAAVELPSWTVPVMLMCSTVMYWWRVPTVLQVVGGMGALAVALNAMPTAPSWVQAAFSMRPLRMLGQWSFSLYLWQQPFYLEVYVGRMPAWLGLLMAFAAGLASYYLIEQPARRWLNANWHSWRQLPWRSAHSQKAPASSSAD